MNAIKFKTKKGLWMTASILMFGVCWLYPMHFGKEGTYPLGRLWPDFFRGNLGYWLPLAFFSVVFGFVALLVGFAVQASVAFMQRRNAEPGAPPNGGPAMPLGSSGVTEGRQR
jgi:hypothetical protein